MEGLLSTFIIAVIIGLVGYFIAYVIPFLNPYRNTVGIVLFLIVMVLWLLDNVNGL